MSESGGREGGGVSRGKTEEQGGAKEREIVKAKGRRRRKGDWMKKGRTTCASDGTHAVQFSLPDGHARPSRVDMVDKVEHAALPPRHALVGERDLGRELADAVLPPEEGKVPDW